MDEPAPATFKQRWSRIDQTADPQQFVRFMDAAIGPDPDDLHLYKGILALLELQEGARILDVGCGLGTASLALAQFVGMGGAVVGLDNSRAMIAEARKRAAHMRLPLAYLQGDAGHLPFPAASFDSCLSTSVFEVVPDPRHALAEVVRVLRPGGQVVIAAPDFGTVAIDAADRAVTRKILHCFADQETNGWIGRQLPGLCVELGLHRVAVVPGTWVERDFAVYDTFWLRPMLDAALAAGAVTPAEGAAWLADLRARAAAGRFFAALTTFAISGHKPA